VTLTFISLVESLLEAVRQSANTRNNAKNGNTNICLQGIVNYVTANGYKSLSHQHFMEKLLPASHRRSSVVMMNEIKLALTFHTFTLTIS